jgi:hypothetical protein
MLLVSSMSEALFWGGFGGRRRAGSQFVARDLADEISRVKERRTWVRSESEEARTREVI